MNLDDLFQLLKSHPGSPTIFNQYAAEHGDLDLPGGAEMRCRNLRCYLDTFAAARYVLVGEAAGYAGCRFSGIPFTCEEQLVGAERLFWTRERDLARSSTADSLWVERSARTVWGVLGQRTDCVLWNAFPWHPFRPDEPLSNRPPGRDLSQGFEVLGCFLSLFPGAQVLAIGRVAERALAKVGVEAPYIRHPSHGGQRAFEAGVLAAVECRDNLLGHARFEGPLSN